MRKLFLSLLAISLLFTSCQSNNQNILSKEEQEYFGNFLGPGENWRNVTNQPLSITNCDYAKTGLFANTTNIEDTKVKIAILLMIRKLNNNPTPIISVQIYPEKKEDLNKVKLFACSQTSTNNCLVGFGDCEEAMKNENPVTLKNLQLNIKSESELELSFSVTKNILTRNTLPVPVEQKVVLYKQAVN